MELRALSRAEYEGYALHFRYVTDRYYDVRTAEDGFTLVETPFEQPQEKHFEDRLFSEWLENPIAFGAFDGEELLGVIEGSVETWHRMFRISNVLVFEGHRGEGVGQALMDRMLRYVRENEPVRGVILETQTCNAPAIRFYRKNGFRLSRIDIREYENDDVARREVRIDLFLEMAQ